MKITKLKGLALYTVLRNKKTANNLNDRNLISFFRENNLKKDQCRIVKIQNPLVDIGRIKHVPIFPQTGQDTPMGYWFFFWTT
jgi:hypothetical protein